MARCTCLAAFTLHYCSSVRLPAPTRPCVRARPAGKYPYDLEDGVDVPQSTRSQVSASVHVRAKYVVIRKANW